MTLRYLSLFSGIEAATVAWHPLGWECVAVAEIEDFPCKALAHHYPAVPNLGDVTKVTEADIAALGRIDLVVFGSPCQDLSVAGKRKGLDGARSGLFFTAMRIIGWAREWGDCRFALWENVPGAFSSNRGRDFAAVVDALAGVDGTAVPAKGWGTEGCAVGQEAMVEWSTLDAQWFGVAQRRRRVFVVADFGNWADRPPILLEPEGMRGDSAPRREAGEAVAGSLAARTDGGGFPGTDEALSGYVVPQQRPFLSPSTGDVAHYLNAGGMGRIDYETETMVVQGYMPARTLAADGGVDERFAPRDICDALHTRSGSGNKAPLVVCATGDVTHTLKADGFDASEDGTGRGTPIIAFNSNAQPDEMRFDAYVSAALTCSQNSVVAFSCKDYGADASDIAPTLRAMGHGASHANAGGQVEVANGLAVRRLTPTECERLQAFPDGYTQVTVRGKPAADGPRYKALGNSMCVNVMRWIGREIDFAWRFF